MRNKLLKVQAFLAKIEAEGLMDEHEAYVIQCEQNMIGGINRRCTNQSTACEDTNPGCKNYDTWCNKNSDNDDCTNLITPDKNGQTNCALLPNTSC